MKNENVIAEGLGTLLADSYTLMIKTHNYHWNVEGAHFPALHALFEGQYTELFAAVDEIAERMRALGAKAPAGLHAFGDLSAVKDGDSRKTKKWCLTCWPTTKPLSAAARRCCVWLRITGTPRQPTC